ncbi:MAG TPA: hypothetical protein VL738_15460 [Dactylosporangium sp.]|jgi:hypothetical protein|nr:hypothetical protein [Dactylosporangium sp.]
MTLRGIPARLAATATAGVLAALTPAAPAGAEVTPTPTLDPDDPAVKAGTLIGRLLPAICCLVVFVILLGVLLVLLNRRKERRARGYR